jgi:hypothetical protein
LVGCCSAALLRRSSSFWRQPCPAPRRASPVCSPHRRLRNRRHARACKAGSALVGCCSAAFSIGVDALRRQMSQAKTVVANKSTFDVGSLVVDVGSNRPRPTRPCMLGRSPRVTCSDTPGSGPRRTKGATFDVGSLVVDVGSRPARPSAEPDKVGAKSSKNASSADVARPPRWKRPPSSNRPRPTRPCMLGRSPRASVP